MAAIPALRSGPSATCVRCRASCSALRARTGFAFSTMPQSAPGRGQCPKILPRHARRRKLCSERAGIGIGALGEIAVSMASRRPSYRLPYSPFSFSSTVFGSTVFGVTNETTNDGACAGSGWPSGPLSSCCTLSRHSAGCRFFSQKMHAVVSGG